jgi:hypothetical protein
MVLESDGYVVTYLSLVGTYTGTPAELTAAK